MTPEPTPRVELDLRAIEAELDAVVSRNGKRHTWATSMPLDTTRELFRRARQLAAVEAFLREHHVAVTASLVGCGETGASGAFFEILRSLGIDAGKRP